MARCRSTQECCQGLREACGDVALPCRTVARWIETFREGRDDVQGNLRTGRTHSLTPCFPVECWSPMDFAWISRGSRSMPQNCAPHSARHSGLPETCSALNIPCNFRGAITALLCSRTGLVRPVPKERWWLSWTNPGLTHTNQTWNANQMNGITPVLLVLRKCALHYAL